MSGQNEIQKSDSKTSIGFPESSSDSGKTPNEKKVTEVNQNEDQVMNISQLLVHCEQHNKICVYKVSSKGFWLPLNKIINRQSWTAVANHLLQKIGINSDEFKSWRGNLINVFRIQMIQSSRFLIRITFLVRITKEQKESKCCSDEDKWVSIETILEKGLDYFWGPEVYLWTKFWIQNESDIIVAKRIEYDTNDALKDYCDNPNDFTTNQQMMVRSAGFTETTILGLYDIFLRHCYPSQFMILMSSKLFNRKIGLRIPENTVLPTFRAFDCRKRCFLKFNDCLLGLAAMNQATEHGGQSGLIRCTYLMRFYDSDSDGFLSHSDICHMIVDIQRLPGSPYKDIYDSKKCSVEEYANQIIKSHGTNDRISLIELTNAIGSLQIRGTSGLFRAKGSVLKHIRKLLKLEKSHLFSVRLIIDYKYHQICESCLQIRKNVLNVVFKASKIGEVLSFFNLMKESPESGIKYVTDFPDTDTFNLTIDLINKLHKIKTIRFDGHTNEEKTSINHWFYPSKQILFNKLIAICEKCKLLFENEERVLQIPSPCYIFGDIHGNFKDLVIFGTGVWRMSPLISESNYLFLGDFVDRGELGVECIIYLFALKLMSPKKVLMCRGNHEFRALQQNFTFYNECIERFSEGIWNAINDCFDRLPIAAVVDRKMFCCHGGIPLTINNIEELKLAPKVLQDPQNQFPAVWEILWNDPMNEDDFRALSDFEKIEVQKLNGFYHNVKRGTAYYYTEIAVDEFFQRNGIQYIIRGHECIPSGYKFLLRGKVVTIFSTSLYCGMKNEASILFVNLNKIRVLRVKTF